MAEPRDVAILYVDEDEEWCNYVVEQFKEDKLGIQIKTVNVTDTASENQPAEMEAAVTESFAVMLLTTCHFMEYMKSQRRSFVPLLQTTNTSTTTIVVATIGVLMKTLQEMADFCKYDKDQWTIIDIDVSGENIKECISQILDIIDTNAENLVRKSSMRRLSGVSRGSLNKEEVDIIPRIVHEEGEKIALIFGNKKAAGSVAVHSGGDQIPVETVNPYCVTFPAPEISGTKITIQVDVNNTRLRRFKLYSRQPPQFTSIELMCQTYGARSKDELDQILAAKFNSSLCTDEHAMICFSRLLDYTPRGRQDSEYPTLLHWAAAQGLKDLCSSLLLSPGALEACHIQNCDGDDVSDLAEKNNYYDLSDFITEFTELEKAVMMSDMYVYSLKTPSKSPGIDSMDEAVNYSRLGTKPDPPKPHKKLLPLESPYDVPSGLRSPSDKDGRYVLPESLFAKKTSEEIIEIQEEVKKGNFNVENAEMLSDSWRIQCRLGRTISFADRQKSIKVLREQNKKALDVLTTLNPKKEMKKDKGETAGLRKKLGNLFRLSSDNEKKADSASSPKTETRDSGISNARDSALSETSASSEDAEVDDMPPFPQINTSHDRAAGRILSLAVQSVGPKMRTERRFSEPAAIPPKRGNGSVKDLYSEVSYY